MSRFTVNVPEYALANRRTMTANRWLAEFMETGPSSGRVFRLRPPVRMALQWPCRAGTLPTLRRTHRHAPELFRVMLAAAASGAVVIGLFCRNWRLDGPALFTLNDALRTPRFKKGGRSIVRYFLDNQRGGHTPTSGSLDDLLSYLEIRPIFFDRIQTPATCAKYYVQRSIGHKVARSRAKKKARKCIKKKSLRM